MKNKEEITKQIRKNIIQASFLAQACHIGSSLSAVEILVDLFWRRMKKDDLFVWSKASGVAALYSVLAEKGYFPRKKIAYYLKKYPLPNRKVLGVMIDGGSCGHGLPQAVGIALALKKDKKKNKVYCLMSDGEIEEGTFWESLLFIRKHKLKNLKIYIDWNQYQACGKIEDILDIPWDFIKKQGIKVIKTKKGADISFIEKSFEKGNPDWHYLNLSKSQYQQALKELK